MEHDWSAKKPPEYCRPHGRRIAGFIDGVGLCDTCLGKDMPMIEVTDDNFAQEVLQSGVPVLVDFYADWCGPCRAAAPTIEAIAGEYEGKAKVAKVNVDNATKYAVENNVRGIPNFIIFKGGQRVGQFVGWSDKTGDSIREALDAALASN